MNQLEIFYDRRMMYIPTDLLQKIHYYLCGVCALIQSPLKSNDVINKMKNYIIATPINKYYIGGIEYRANISRHYNVNGPNNALWYGFNIFNNFCSGDRHMPRIFQILIENSYSGLW